MIFKQESLNEYEYNDKSCSFCFKNIGKTYITSFKVERLSVIYDGDKETEEKFTLYDHILDNSLPVGKELKLTLRNTPIGGDYRVERGNFSEYDLILEIKASDTNGQHYYKNVKITINPTSDGGTFPRITKKILLNKKEYPVFVMTSSSIRVMKHKITITFHIVQLLCPW